MRSKTHPRAAFQNVHIKAGVERQRPQRAKPRRQRRRQPEPVTSSCSVFMCLRFALVLIGATLGTFGLLWSISGPFQLQADHVESASPHTFVQRLESALESHLVHHQTLATSPPSIDLANDNTQDSPQQDQPSRTYESHSAFEPLGDQFESSRNAKSPMLFPPLFGFQDEQRDRDFSVGVNWTSLTLTERLHQHSLRSERPFDDSLEGSDRVRVYFRIPFDDDEFSWNSKPTQLEEEDPRTSNDYMEFHSKGDILSLLRPLLRGSRAFNRDRGDQGGAVLLDDLMALSFCEQLGLDYMGARRWTNQPKEENAHISWKKQQTDSARWKTHRQLARFLHIPRPQMRRLFEEGITFDSQKRNSSALANDDDEYYSEMMFTVDDINVLEPTRNQSRPFRLKVQRAETGSMRPKREDDLVSLTVRVSHPAVIDLAWEQLVVLLNETDEAEGALVTDDDDQTANWFVPRRQLLHSDPLQSNEPLQATGVTHILSPTVNSSGLVHPLIEPVIEKSGFTNDTEFISTVPQGLEVAGDTSVKRHSQASRPALPLSTNTTHSKNKGEAQLLQTAQTASVPAVKVTPIISDRDKTPILELPVLANEELARMEQATEMTSGSEVLNGEELHLAQSNSEPNQDMFGLKAAASHLLGDIEVGDDAVGNLAEHQNNALGSILSDLGMGTLGEESLEAEEETASRPSSLVITISISMSQLFSASMRSSLRQRSFPLSNFGKVVHQSNRSHNDDENDTTEDPLLWYRDGAVTVPRSLEGRLARNVMLPISRLPYYTAVHIRRGDVGPYSQTYRYLPHAYFRKVIDTIHQVVPDMPVVILSETKAWVPLKITDIHSDTTPGALERDFSDCFLFVDKPLPHTWKVAMAANLFVMSKSAFSYIPALYSNGLVLYNPFFHSPLRHWRRVFEKVKSIEAIQRPVKETLNITLKQRS